MCNPTLIVAGLSAGLQFAQAQSQAKALEAQQKRQNEIALANLAQRRKSESLKLRQVTLKNLEKIEEAERDVRRRRAKFTAGKTFTGNTFNALLANYYRSEADYRNTVLGNIQQNKFQFNRTMEALSTTYDAQSTYVTAPNFMYTAGASALAFAGDYYSYKAKKNANNVNDDYYGYEEKTEYDL